MQTHSQGAGNGGNKKQALLPKAKSIKKIQGILETQANQIKYKVATKRLKKQSAKKMKVQMKARRRNPKHTK